MPAMTDAGWPGASSPLAALGKELQLSDEPKSAAILTALLRHYQSQSSKQRLPLYSVLDEQISPPEMVCHLGLSAATVWVSASTARAEALAKHDILMRQVESWTSSLLSTGSEPVVPYISGLQLLLRLCMNSAKSAAAVLGRDIGESLAAVVAAAHDTRCAALAAAILAVCFIQCPGSAERTAGAANAAGGQFMARQRAAAGQGQALATDAIYMVLNMVELARRRHAQLDALEAIVISTLHIWGDLVDSGHLLAISMALTVTTPAVRASDGLKRLVDSTGSLGKLVDLLSSISLSKSSLRSAAAPRDEPLCVGSEQLVELTVAALHFLEAFVTPPSPESTAALLGFYPSIIFRELLASEQALVVAGACAFVARLADGNAAAQRYCRLEEVLSKVDDALTSNAELLRRTPSSDDSPEVADVVRHSARALSALITGCPDNHMHVANGGGTRRAMGTLACLAAAQRAASPAMQPHLDAAAAELAMLCLALSKNITNRKLLAASQSVDAVVDVVIEMRARGRNTATTDAGECSDANEATDTLLHVLVALVTAESNVARHLVERDGFMPLLFALLATEPLPPYLDNVAALLLVLIRDCKINKPMLIKVGVPAIVRTLQRHSNRSLSPTTVQALSGVLTLLAMSKTMLDIVLQTGGLPLIVELLRYEAPDSSAANAPDTIDVVASVHEAACVLISCLCDLSSKARAQIAQTDNVVSALVEKVLGVPRSEVAALARATPPPRNAAPAEQPEAAQGDQAIVSALGQLMQSSGPDNFVFKAAMQAMQSVQRQQAAQLADVSTSSGGRRSDGGQSAEPLGEDRTFGLDDFGDRKEQSWRQRPPAAAIPPDTKLQLALAAINTLFRLLHTVPDKARHVWAAGGAPLVQHIILLASHCTQSFEEAATKLLVVFFSHRQVQEAARTSGLISHMVSLIDTMNKTTVLIATKALAVVCRNSAANQRVAIEERLLDKCIHLLATDLDMYTAKWVILVMNALVYENNEAQQAMLDQGAVPLMVRWLSAGPQQEVATAAARALAKAAKGNRGIQQAICDADGVAGLMAMLSGTPGSLAVRAAAEALSDVAKENPAGQECMRQAGALEQLLHLLVTAMHSSSLIVTIVKALSVLAHSNDANMEALFHGGAIPLLLDMLHPRFGHICNAAAADLIRVLCSNSLCQQQLLRNQGLRALLSALKGAEHAAAQSATVWAVNALVQGQKSILPELLQAGTVETLIHCIQTHNGAAPGAVRLLLVVFLHSGKHEDLRAILLAAPNALLALLSMLRKGPALEPTKWTASLLSTLCWQEVTMKQQMAELDAPQALAQVLRMAVAALQGQPAGDTRRMIVEASISTLQALISLVDESSSRGAQSATASAAASRSLQELTLEASCVPLIGQACTLCMAAILAGQDAPRSGVDPAGQLQKLLKPVLRSLDWLLPHTKAMPPEIEAALTAIVNCPQALPAAKRHAASLLDAEGRRSMRPDRS